MILYIDAITIDGRILAIDAFTAMDFHSGQTAILCAPIRPDGWTVPDGYPITHVQAVNRGIRPLVALTTLADMAKTATTVVFHNRKRIGGAIVNERQHAGRDGQWMGGAKPVCTAKAAAPVLKMRPAEATQDDAFIIPSLVKTAAFFNIKAKGSRAVAAIHEKLVQMGALEKA